MNRLYVTPYSVKHAKKLEVINEISGFVVGDNTFGLRQVRNFDLQMIKELKLNSNKLIFVAITKLFHNHELAALEKYLIELAGAGVDYVIFSDFAVLNLIKKNNLKLKLLYSTETTITNKYFTEYAKEIGVDGVDVAKEITLKEIAEIVENKQSKVAINIHSHLYMYQSVRKMITNYGDVQSQSYSQEKEYYLFDEERNVYYPLVENEQGTHLLASNDICMINHLDKLLDLDVDFLKLDAFGYKEAEFDEILSLYLDAIQMYEENPELYVKNHAYFLHKVKEIVEHKKMGTGFYFKKTVF